MRFAAGLFGALAAALAAPATAAEPCAEGLGARACYAAPTARYPHAVLGDDLEWGALVVTLADGRRLETVLPDDRVFEDLAPRIFDLGGDGVPDVVTVESSAAAGAQLAVYEIRPRGLAKAAATPEIGTRFRWLAPAAWQDLDGDGGPEIAYVDRPHLAGVLRVWRFVPGGLTEVASEAGFSNHRIGDAFILSAVRDCGAGPEIVLPDFGWSALRAVRLEAGALVWRRLEEPPTPEGLAAATTCG